MFTIHHFLPIPHTCTMFYPLFLFVLLFSHGNAGNAQSFEMLPLPPPTIGPEALAFDPSGVGPYASVGDGRILKWQGPSTGFVDFTAASPSRTKQQCDGSSDPAKEPSCGRPLGLEFNNRSGDLYFVDSYYGLHVVGHGGGNATLLATEAEGFPFTFLNAVDVDQGTGIVYFTDASSRFQRRDFLSAVLAGDSSGRLMKYDPGTKQVTVLWRDLSLAAGVAVAKDGSFVLVSEYITARILRYWVRGPKANTTELFLIPPGNPDNIRRNERGEFWVAVNAAAAVPLGIRVSEEGKVLQVVHFFQTGGDTNESISEVHEYDGVLYIGSLGLRFVGVVTNYN